MTPETADFLLGVIIFCVIGIIVVGLAWIAEMIVEARKR